MNAAPLNNHNDEHQIGDRKAMASAVFRILNAFQNDEVSLTLDQEEIEHLHDFSLTVRSQTEQIALLSGLNASLGSQVELARHAAEMFRRRAERWERVGRLAMAAALLAFAALIFTW